MGGLQIIILFTSFAELPANHNTNMQELSANHSADIQELSANHNTGMQDLSANHNADMRELSANHNADMQELSANHNADILGVVDNLVNQLVDTLLKQVFQGQPLFREDLDTTLLAKAYAGKSQSILHTKVKPSHHTFPLFTITNGIPFSRPVIPHSPISHGTLMNSNYITHRIAHPIAAGGSDVDSTKFSIEVDIGSGVKPVQMDFELSAPGNTMLQATIEFVPGKPLGIKLEESAGKIVVVQSEDAGYASGVRVGDIVRATSCGVQKTPNEFSLFSGQGVLGKGSKQRALFVVDGFSLAKTLEEIGSNAALDPPELTLVLERPPAGENVV
eukprot:gnl/MRDRNA2_/MRDRNA2_77031_c0_seq1.p1 gnl/MRDRNA2_/MRDRNA2_77031_c0~~gnl/MRDRNA2_/MRDRNA2_77031_c0_seq1.p1  ORF type:complete len:332 (+),score=58.75 gnl/MRDRNA2_/MRDRNA2_77031_c0_seq1:75-1070(+)